METKHLIIRESTFDDCKYFAEWETSPEITEFFTMDEGRDYEQVVRDFIDSGHDVTKLQFTITLKPEALPIGRIIITRIDKKYDSLDITRIYIADPENRNKGYGEEALRRLLEYVFINMHMERVTIDHFIKNRAASYLYDKIGFQDEGILRNAGKKNGKYIDFQLKSMIRSEFLNGNRNIL